MDIFMNSIEWLKKLISFDTTSRNSNLKLIDAISEWFASHGIATKLTHDSSGKKANLFATLPARDGAKEGGLMLSGHTDVVPVDGQQWDTDPFHATQIDNRIYGRGTCDMKSFIAVSLALLPEFQRLKLSQPLHFAFSYDEEVGCLGAPVLLAEMQKNHIQPHACIVGEPTEMRAVVAHKGINVFRCRFQGLAAHSSLTTQGCNAIEHAAKLICWIREFSNQFRQQGPFDSHYDVPFTSMTTNMIKGGNAVNTIPNECEFIFEFRNLSVVDPKHVFKQIQTYIKNDLLPSMQHDFSDAKIELDQLAAVPGLEASEQAAITQLTRALTNKKDTLKVAYATEAGLFQNSGIPTIVCGPGSIEQAHRANEFIFLEQINQCEKFLLNIVKNN